MFIQISNLYIDFRPRNHRLQSATYCHILQISDIDTTRKSQPNLRQNALDYFGRVCLLRLRIFIQIEAQFHIRPTEAQHIIQQFFARRLGYRRRNRTTRIGRWLRQNRLNSQRTQRRHNSYQHIHQGIYPEPFHSSLFQCYFLLNQLPNFHSIQV